MKNTLIAVLLIWGATATFETLAQPLITATLSDIQLKALNTGTLTPLVSKNKLNHIAMIFQPHCTWCKKQAKWLSQINQHCQQHINVLLIGARANKQALKRDYKHYPKDLAAYQASEKFLRMIEGVTASPTTIFFNQQGKLIGKRRGYLNAKQLYQAASLLSNNTCVLPVI